MVNRFDRAAEAPILNTYVPIDFDALYKIGSAQKAAVDQARAELSAAVLKFGEFKSPSQVDTKNYYANTFGKLEDLIDQAALNPDAMKDASFRSNLFSRINNLDYAKLSLLKLSADTLTKGLEMRAKMEAEGRYNENWDMSDIPNYDTLGTGRIFEDITPIRYMTANELSNPYFDQLKPSSMGSVWKDGVKYDRSAITMGTLQGIAEARFNDLVNTPQGQMYYREALAANGGNAEAAKQAFVNMIADSQRDRLINNDTINSAWLQQSLYGIRYGSKGDAAVSVPARSERMTYDLSNHALGTYNTPEVERAYMDYAKTGNPESYAKAVLLANKSRVGVMENAFKETSGFDLEEDPENNKNYSRKGYIRGAKAALERISVDTDMRDNDVLLTALRGKPNEYTLSNGMKQEVYDFSNAEGFVLPEELFAIATKTKTTKAYDRDLFWHDEIKFKEALHSNLFGAIQFIPDGLKNLVQIGNNKAISGRIRIPRNVIESVFGTEWFGTGKRVGYKEELGMTETTYKMGDDDVEFYDFPIYRVLPADNNKAYWDYIDAIDKNSPTAGGLGSATMTKEDMPYINTLR